MVKNEEYFIQAVLRPLVDVCGAALVGDSGSTDETVKLARAVPGVEVIEWGPLDMETLGRARGELGKVAHGKGYAWTMLVDGDELYCRATLQMIRETLIPEGRLLGFTTSKMLDRAEDGSLWELDEQAGRTAVHPALTEYVGPYPFEAQKLFGRPETFFYFAAPPGYRYHCVHLHRLARSSRDADVAYRVAKQKQFCMMDQTIARTRPFDLADWQAR
jgi:hypothetical protein